ncbi:hypothetical protein [Frigoribacterium sp. CFBP 13605]|uniref:hypothetical protein n=1 Tax=Frigoribacterium sp. CFBP 13605 TaxID=2774034 RepID=UPI0027DAAA0A|nr:hypothetical protein [Frigoribacterium sp. CFBP 13605]
MTTTDLTLHRPDDGARPDHDPFRADALRDRDDRPDPRLHRGHQHAGPATARRPRPDAAAWRSLGLHVLIPLFLATGMALAYLGAFGHPTPHHVPVAVVGSSAQSEVFAQQLNDADPDALDVRTVADADAARRLITDREISGAFEVGATDATLYVSSAASDTTASVLQKVFGPVAYRLGLPLKVDDVVPSGEGDPTGQGLFFLLVALSVGAYASAAAISAASARLGLGSRLLAGVVTAAVIAAIGTVVVGPVYGIVTTGLWGVALVSWLYVTAVVVIGIGLHPLLRHWTTPALTMLFVMLNFTSSGGVFSSQLVPPFFGALGAFWNGSAWLHATQSIVYFPGQAWGRAGLTLALWLAAGLALAGLTHLWSVRRTRLANERVAVREDEEGIAA